MLRDNRERELLMKQTDEAINGDDPIGEERACPPSRAAPASKPRSSTATDDRVLRAVCSVCVCVLPPPPPPLLLLRRPRGHRSSHDAPSHSLRHVV